MLCMSWVSCKQEIPSEGTPDYTVQYLEIDGVDPTLLSLDIYIPQQPDVLPAPVVVWIHGGGWHTGDKANRMAYKEALFDSLGYVLVSINYRLSQEGMDYNDSLHVHYPIHNQDVATAVSWIFIHIEEYGGNPQKIVLMGHSAGAHLVALTATDTSLLGTTGYAPSWLRGVASFDTEGYDVYATQTYSPNDIYNGAFGNNPDIWKQASPIYHTSHGQPIPPFLMCERGSTLRKNILHRFADSLLLKGTPVTIIDANALSHEEVNTYIGKTGDSFITPGLIQFLANCFE